jgi:hypothetical protein
VALKPKSAIKWIKTGMGMENKIGPPWANNLSDDDWQAWSCQVPWDWALVSSSQFIQPFSRCLVLTSIWAVPVVSASDSNS